MLMIRVGNFLNGCADHSVSLKEVFIRSTNEEIAQISTMVEGLSREQSHESVKSLLLALSAIPSILESSSGGSSTARNIYISFVTLVHFFRLGSTGLSDADTIPAILHKVIFLFL